MKTCVNCGEKLEDNALFCDQCGCKAEAPAPQGGSFCGQCGAKMEPGGMFCPECGAKADTFPAASQSCLDAGKAPASSGGLKKKTVGIIAGAVAAVLVLALVIGAGASGVFASPAKKFTKYQKAVLVDGMAGKVVEMAESYNDYELSTDMTITADSSYSTLSRLLEDTALTLKVDSKGNASTVGAEVVYDGETLLTGVFTYDSGKMGVYLPELDSHYYTADLVKLAENNGGDLEGLANAQRVQIPTKKLKNITERYLNVLLSTADKGNVEVTKDKKIRYSALSGSGEGTLYTFTPSEEDIEATLLLLADELEKDEDIRNFFVELIGDNGELYEQMFPGSDLDDIGTTIGDGLEDLADELRDEAEYMAEELYDEDFRWKLYVEGKKPRKICWELNGGENAMGIELKDDGFGAYIQEGDYSTMSVAVSYEKNGKNYDGKIVLTQDIAWYGTQEVTIRFSDVSETKSALGLRYGTYSTNIDGVTLKLEVGKASGGSDHTLNISGTGVSGDLELNLHTTDKSATVKKPKGKEVDITNFDEDELEELLYDWGDELSNIAGRISQGDLEALEEIMWYLF